MKLTKKQKQELQEAEDHYRTVCKSIVEAHYPIGTRFQLIWNHRFGASGYLGPFKITGYSVLIWSIANFGEQVYLLYKKIDKLGRANGDEHQISLDDFSRGFRKLPNPKQTFKRIKKKKTNA